MGRGVWSRREVLRAGAGAAGVLLAACGRSTVRQAATTAPAGSDLGAVEHVIYVTLENRSFDHYFGAYRGVRGFDDHPAGLAGAFAQPWPQRAGETHDDRLLPFHLDTSSADAECTVDLSHEWDAQHLCWGQGAMDGWASTHTSTRFEGPDAGVLTMGYYARADLDFYYALADAFTLCDGYHCSVLGPTHPNRLHALSGTLGPHGGHQGGPVLITDMAASAQFSVSWPTMPERLQDKGVSWKTYNPANPSYRPSSGVAIAISDNILLYFSQYRDPSSELYRRAFLPTYPDDFERDVARDELPAVSWIIPSVGQDEHPPTPPAVGMAFVHRLLTTLVSNPKVWAKTVVFVTYDENDGFFDHVAPPTPPPGTPGEYLTVHPLPREAKGIAGPIGLGFRVPMLVLSPFSRGGFVCSDTFDHTSQMRFLETRFGTPAPNISAWRRSVTGDLSSAVLGGAPDTSVPTLPATPGRSDPRVARECQPSQLSEVTLGTPPAYPVPSPQSLPTQEPGTARRAAARPAR